MVSVVQSQMANGTSRHFAMVCASSVLPLPVDPNIIMLDLSSLRSWVVASRMSLPTVLADPGSTPSWLAGASAYTHKDF